MYFFTNAKLAKSTAGEEGIEGAWIHRFIQSKTQHDAEKRIRDYCEEIHAEILFFVTPRSWRSKDDFDKWVAGIQSWMSGITSDNIKYGIENPMFRWRKGFDNGNPLTLKRAISNSERYSMKYAERHGCVEVDVISTEEFVPSYYGDKDIATTKKKPKHTAAQVQARIEEELMRMDGSQPPTKKKEFPKDDNPEQGILFS